MKIIFIPLIIANFVCFATAIVNGINAGSTPYQVSIQVNGTHLCGGTIIHPRFILTIGHFFVKTTNYPYTSIFAGSLKLSEGGVRYYPEKFIIHEQISAVLPYHYDLAMIKIKKDIVFNDLVQLIPLMQTYLPAGTDLTFTGWGLANISTNYRPDHLQTLTLTIVGPQECHLKYGVTPGKGEFCSHSQAGSGPCNNDSGGPVVYHGKLYGIDSFGNSFNCDGEKPDITTSVPFHRSWIVDNMNKNM